MPTGSMHTQLISVAPILVLKTAASWSKATKSGLTSVSLLRDLPSPLAQE